MLNQGQRLVIAIAALSVIAFASYNIHAEPLDTDSVIFALGHVDAVPGDTIPIPFSINTVFDVNAYNFLFSMENESLSPLALDPTGTRAEGLPVFLGGFGGSTEHEIAGVVAFDPGVTIPAGSGPVNNIFVETDGTIERGSLLALTLYNETIISGRMNMISDDAEVEHYARFNNGSVLFGLDFDGVVSAEMGDINLNGMAFEVADYVLFQIQLTTGFDPSETNYEQRTYNSDADYDLLPWTISDYLTVKGVVSGAFPPIPSDTVCDIINNPGDSIWFDDFFGTPTTVLEIPIYMSNENDAGAVTFSLDYSSIDLELIEANMSGSRIPSEWDMVEVNSRDGGLLFAAWPNSYQTSLDSPLPSGSGLITTLRFNVLNPATEIIDFKLTRLQYNGRVNGYALWGNDRWSLAGLQNKEATIEFAFIRGDANSSGYIDIDDAVFLITYLFQSGPAPSPTERGDFNGDLIIDIDDVVAILTYLFG